MRRREEKLADRFSGVQLPERLGCIAWIRRLRIRPLTCKVIEPSVDISSRMEPQHFDFHVSAAAVRDGLGTLSLNPPGSGAWSLEQFQCLPGAGAEFFPSSLIHDADIRSDAEIRNISMPGTRQVRIRQKRLIFASKPIPATMNLQAERVHALNLFQNSSVAVKNDRRLFLADPTIGTAGRIFELPHRRKSTSLEMLTNSERRSFLQEGEALRRLPRDQAELMAVFRHVPIEVISRLRFVEERKEIVYSIFGEPKRTQTRVHDMAAIRDAITREIHLVPHRTRSRLVQLN